MNWETPLGYIGLSAWWIFWNIWTVKQLRKKHRRSLEDVLDAVKDLHELRRRYDQLQSQYNNLFLENLRLRKMIESYNRRPQFAGPTEFSKLELNQLIKLCHPDRHGNSTEANDMTKRLLELRKCAK